MHILVVLDLKTLFYASNMPNNDSHDQPSWTKHCLTLLFTFFGLCIAYQVAVYVVHSWMAFCVFYTCSDLYQKRKTVHKYVKLGLWWLGIERTKEKRQGRKTTNIQNNNLGIN